MGHRMGYLTLAFLLILGGLLLLVAELFIPSGIFFVLALCAVIGGVVIAFLYSDDPYAGWLTLTFVFVALPTIAGLIFHYWPKTPMGRRFFLRGPDEDATLAQMPVNVELEQLRGRIGRTLSTLRPAGVVDFDGRRVDVITEGMMVDADQWVRCIDVKAGKVIVRPVDKPRPVDFENADFT
jgi:membrane-bound serine protease (ClpP class)